MIKLNINIDPLVVFPKFVKYTQDVLTSLQKIEGLIPGHTSEDFKSRLWKNFKLSIWGQQFHKCAFCEKELLCADDAQLEHFRPKTEVSNEENITVTREAYWWLAYEHKNYIVSCSTCNNLKGNKFPLENEGARVTATKINGTVGLTDDGLLGAEIPLLINPRYRDPKPYIAYSYKPLVNLVFIYPQNDQAVGEKTIQILDLNKVRKNKDGVIDFLPEKRGSVFGEFRKELRSYRELINTVVMMRKARALNPDVVTIAALDDYEFKANKKRDIIKARFLSSRGEFPGMCSFWLEYDPDLDDLKGYFIAEAA